MRNSRIEKTPFSRLRSPDIAAGSDAGGQRAAIIYNLIGTALLNAVDATPACTPCSNGSQIIRCGIDMTLILKSQLLREVGAASQIF